MHIDFTSKLHTATKRNYLERVADHDKAACAEVANKYGGDPIYAQGVDWCGKTPAVDGPVITD